MAYAERRSVPRAETDTMMVKVDGYCLHSYGYAKDISSSGMKLRTFSTCPPDEIDMKGKIRVEFALPDLGPKVTCIAEPVWGEKLTGGIISTILQGVRFKDIDPASQVEIYEWVVEHM
jgi:PilZ domain